MITQVTKATEKDLDKDENGEPNENGDCEACENKDADDGIEEITYDDNEEELQSFFTTTNKPREELNVDALSGDLVSAAPTSVFSNKCKELEQELARTRDTKE